MHQSTLLFNIEIRRLYMKKQLFLMALLCALSLAACGGKPEGGSKSSSLSESSEEEYHRPSRSSSSSSTFSGDPNVEINNYGTIRFEAENINTANWVTSSVFPSPVMASEKASGGYYLASSTGDTTYSGTCDFVLKLNQPSKITMTAAYCQSSKWLSNDEDMSLTYAFVIETTSQQIPYGDDHILRARTEEFDWYRMTYRSITLPKGDHKITMSVISNTSTGCPCTDYLDFLIEEPSGDIPEPPVTDSVPDNDFHTLVQYQYNNDPDWHNIRNYAQGTQELSIPRALNLKFDDVADASKYYVQVAKGVNNFSGAKTYETTAKYYELWNAELGETYYYKAATSEAGLASATAKEFKVATQAPRNLKVGGISNFRDVGGWKSSLIPNGVIKQGLYYRCANPNNITSEGKAAIKELGIKLDIDMRDSYQVPSTSAASTADWPVAILKASIPSGTESRRWEDYGEVYKPIFEAIADADNNPIMLHCTAGADRTGIATFFLLALCGVSEEDIGRDYCYTNFSTQGFRDYNSEFVNWVSKTKSTYADKPTFAEQMKAHLMSKGLSSDTLETIRVKFVPGYVKDQDPYIPTDETPEIPSNGIALKAGEEVKFEAENATPTAWKNSGWGSNSTFVADDADANASGGKFVTPSTGNVDANRKFSIVIYAPKAGEVSMKVAYCRGGKNSKTATIDYSYVYQYRLDGETGKFTCVTADHTDSSVASWDWRLIEFKFTVTEGLHTIEGYLDSQNANTNAGCPCIDYYLFKLAA